MAELPELGHLNRQEISALAGLAPFNRDSGQHAGKRSIWGGRVGVRGTLYMAALSARRCNPLIRRFAERFEGVVRQLRAVLVGTGIASPTRADSAAGRRFAERILTAVATLRQRGHDVLNYLERAVAAYRLGQPAPGLLAGRGTVTFFRCFPSSPG